MRDESKTTDTTTTRAESELSASDCWTPQRNDLVWVANYEGVQCVVYIQFEDEDSGHRVATLERGLDQPPVFRVFRDVYLNKAAAEDGRRKMILTLL